ncbi:DNA-binding protein [Azospirillum rugosum]|uniref:Uncharacterized protein (TIGR00725 family) n=1 Tax=Azospirillum rugosum TaxID=416170 RepID=A0ABS4SS63_9PROT|nr:DNA-binding protein [Azospirillum rugosum]MBP2295397.1 uncharacterized protein (TIGR00725 family) [Azospirillum rugosum]MDQ0528772.1 uncharacterized protein (TIGR00725 family) [Azospirillum rugosum]
MAIIGVMGSGKDEWDAFATPLGIWIAENGHDLLTGGGNGVMLAAARAFFGTPGRRGRSIGVLPSEPDPVRGFVPLPGYPNPFIDLTILTPFQRKGPDDPPDALSRNHVNILTAQVIVALPGRHGTLDEVRLALAFGKPIIGFGPDLEFRGVPAELRTTGDFAAVAAFITDRLSHS